jgi:hypothetical protein
MICYDRVPYNIALCDFLQDEFTELKFKCVCGRTNHKPRGRNDKCFRKHIENTL